MSLKPLEGQDYTLGDLIDRAPVTPAGTLADTPEAPADTPADTPEAPADTSEASEPTHKIVLEGKGLLEGCINGNLFAVTRGVEIEVSESIYNAVKAHIEQER